MLASTSLASPENGSPVSGLSPSTSGFSAGTRTVIFFPPLSFALPSCWAVPEAVRPLAEKSAASAGRASSSAVISASIVQISFFMSE